MNAWVFKTICHWPPLVAASINVILKDPEMLGFDEKKEWISFWKNLGYMGISAHWKRLSLHIYEGPYNTELYLLDLEQHMLSSN